MARRQMIEVECSRCGKIENQIPTEADNYPKPELTITLHGVTTRFEDLCNGCRKSVANYFSRVSRNHVKEPPAGSSPTPVDGHEVKKEEPAPSGDKPKRGLFGI